MDKPDLMMKRFFVALFLLVFFGGAGAQSVRVKADKYPSLLWEISGKGLARPSYLFGTMHVSSKLAFHLSDSFYTALRSAQVVALETNPGSWQEDFNRYDLSGDAAYGSKQSWSGNKGRAQPADYLTISSLRMRPYEKLLEASLYSNHSMVNSFLYRSASERSSDFEEDTYLDLHIYQAGKKLGKKICGVEDFDGSMRLVQEAYADAAKEKRTTRRYNYEEEFSYRRLDEAYRSGNLDLLDTINKVNSQSAAFDEKFLYRRNEIQAAAIDSILKKKLTLFVGVGAAHLPGQRGVIEWLRRAGYTLRPIKMKERDSRYKEVLEKLRVPVVFTKQTATDGFFSVQVPGKLYSFDEQSPGLTVQQFADMANGSYYTVTRLLTSAALQGQSESDVERKVDSVLYENIPGKILSKTRFVQNGFRGFAVQNRTRRGDHQRYRIYITPFEILIFKMSGNNDYVLAGTEADRFFNSIQIGSQKTESTAWKKYTPPGGGFAVKMPHKPFVFRGDNRQYLSTDEKGAAYAVWHNTVHHHGFASPDELDLNLMEESFSSSEVVNRVIDRKNVKVNGYPALDVQYRYNDSSQTFVRFVIRGPHYFTLIAHGSKAENREDFLNSFVLTPFEYGVAKLQADTALGVTVQSPIPLFKKEKLSMYSEEALYEALEGEEAPDNGNARERIIESDSTGEKIYVSVSQVPQYYQAPVLWLDSIQLRKKWYIRRYQRIQQSDSTEVVSFELGNPASSRMLKGKAFVQAGKTYLLQTSVDTLSAPSSFVTSFFNSFSPVGSKNNDSQRNGAALFFAHFFSMDSVLHKKAVANIQVVDFDSAYLPQLERSIASLTWKEKKYLEVKKAFLEQVGTLPSLAASNYLHTVYYAAGDTLELQYAALQSLLEQRTKYSYSVFAGIMQTDPPVMELESENGTYTVKRKGSYTSIEEHDGASTYTSLGSSSFLDRLTDSLPLTAGIYPSLSPLLNLNDYEEPLMQLTGLLVDSGLLAPKMYESFLPKFLIEARQTLKRQQIAEKQKSIELAGVNEEEKKSYRLYGGSSKDFGNNKLSLYATLLVPYWTKNEGVPVLINQLLRSSDNRLKFNTTLLLLRRGLPLPDTLLPYFAADDAYRLQLYTYLLKLNQVLKMPAAYRTQEALAMSQLYDELSDKPDTVHLILKQPVSCGHGAGLLFVYKYKEQKKQSTWRLAAVGALPADSSQLLWRTNPLDGTRHDHDFTEGAGPRLKADAQEGEQVQKFIKRLTYRKQNSAAAFYTEEDNEVDGNRFKY